MKLLKYLYWYKKEIIIGMIIMFIIYTIILIILYTIYNDYMIIDEIRECVNFINGNIKWDAKIVISL